MWNVHSCNKKYVSITLVIFIIVIGLCISLTNSCKIERISKVYALEIVNRNANESANKTVEGVYETANESEVEKQLGDKIDDILGDIDSSELDEFLSNDFELDFIGTNSFLDIVKGILTNKYFTEYNSLFSGIISLFFNNIKEVFIFFFSLFMIIIINQIFDSFCENKYGDFKKVVNIIFSLVVAIQILALLKDVSSVVEGVISKTFSFSEKLFPILLGLVLLSGANGTYSVYSTLSSYLIESGLYIFKFVLMPIVSSIIILSILSIAFRNDKFSKLISLLKSIFKYIIVAFFAILGIFSTINMFSSGVSDGVNYKLTKFALKSYIPIIGGYVSDGFDFVHTCSVLVKNSFGICGVIVLFLSILKPFVVCAIYIFMFKILAVMVSFLGKEKYANYFETISGSFSYYLSVLVGVFLCLFVFIFLLILSVSVV